MAYQPGVNSLNLRSLYPRATGESTGVAGSSATPTNDPAAGNSPKGANSEVAQAAAIGASGSPLVALGVMAIMLFALMFIAKRFGSEGSQFASIKLSIYNVFVIALAAVVGINFFKLVFTRFKVPGVSAAILAV